jgi:hypothetical protein
VFPDLVHGLRCEDGTLIILDDDRLHDFRRWPDATNGTPGASEESSPASCDGSARIRPSGIETRPRNRSKSHRSHPAAEPRRTIERVPKALPAGDGGVRSRPEARRREPSAAIMRTNRSGESLLLLLDVLDLLDSQKVPYAVIGALAASLHGAVRASMDADLVLSASMREAQALERDFRAAGFRTQLTRGGFADPVPGLLRLDDLFGNRVDLLLGLRGLEPQAFSRVVEVPFQGRIARFIGREDFIAMKTFAGWPLDLVDAARDITAPGPSLDIELARRLAKRYGPQASERLDHLLRPAKR